jgi:2-oxo-3-hexenedioate decarboxylase/2-keto-4-pentenoate hydratase
VSVEFERTAVVLITRLVKTVWLKAGDSVMMELSGLGTVAVDFPN